MAEERLGLFGAISIAVGGMIGGGVFSVLGVVATVAGDAAWLAFTVACLVSMCAAYSYLKLNSLGDRTGGSVSQFEEYVGNSTVAGMVGWTLLVGYVGAIAMYAYAFGSFGEALIGMQSVAGVPLHPVLSVLAVGIFVALNVLGARATGTSEEALVAAKVAVLLFFGLAGLYFGFQQDKLSYGASQIASVTPVVMATAISFVSFQGWQLLVYDQDTLKNASENLPKAIYLSIVITIVIDGLIAIIVTSLVETQTITANPERALAIAVEPMFGHLGFVAVSVAALFSTGSAINGTLFSAANFAKGMIGDGLFPDTVGRAGVDGAPTRTVLVLGALSALFAAYGSLDGITSFGSLAFMAVFGAMSYLAFRKRDEDAVNPVVPAVGVLGVVAFFPLLLYHLYTAQFQVFVTVLFVALAVGAVELVYFERDSIEDGITEFHDEVEAFTDDVTARLD